MNIALIDIILAVILLWRFARGYVNGFLSSLLSCIVIVGSVFITVIYAKEIVEQVSFLQSLSPYVTLIIIFVISNILLSLVKVSLTSLIPGAGSAGNFLFGLLGGLFEIIITLVVLSLALEIAHRSGISYDSIPSWNGSYSEKVYQYIANIKGLNLSARIDDFFSLVQNTLSKLK